MSELPIEDINSLTNLSDLEDMDEESNKKVDNPFLELRQLVSDKKINVKTILTEPQIIRLHRINTVINDLDVSIESFDKSNRNSEERIKAMNNVKKLLTGYTNNFMTLVINKEGTSRKQFIEALSKGTEKAEESRRDKTLKMLGV